MKPLELDDESRVRITVTTETDFDPAAATVEVSVDGTWHAATWTETATYTPPGKWTRRAQTTGYFAGPAATANGATVLAAGSHSTQARITSGGDVVVAGASVIEVG